MLTSTTLSSASCSIPANTMQRIDFLKKVESSSTINFELGLAQVDIPGCLDAAVETFRDLSNTNDNGQKRLATGMLAMANARKMIQSGDRRPATQTLVNIAGSYPEFPVYLRAVSDLTLLLQAQPNAPEWQFLTAQLDSLTSTEDVAGITSQAVAQIALHDISVQHADVGLARMEQYLAKPHSVQIRLSSSVLYLELLWKAGYAANARILCRQLDNDVGNMELDPSMRVRFLQVCSSVYLNSADPQGQMRYGRFAAALARARSELQ
jgi:hypothetical protein